MGDDPRLLRLALERGWITREQAQSGRPVDDLLSTPQIQELRDGQDLAARLLKTDFLKGEDLPEGEPERFGRYEIQRALGAGGGGRVFLARDPSLGRAVAVKILDRGIMAQPDRFRREMEILASIRHPNIVAIYDAGTQDGRPYYAMEYAEGGSLSGRKMPLREAVAVLEQVALACHAAHEKGVIHRDLKPANVLFSDRPLVADFGIAKVAGPELTETGQTLGTPYYMSPEQAEGKDVDARTDVYALGVLLYEAMTGQRPFTGTSTFEILKKVAEGDAAPPRSIDPSLPRDLEAVALRAIARKPGRRYASALEFAGELRAWLDGRPVRARPAGPLGRAARAFRRHPRILAAAGVLILLLVAYAVGSPRLRYEWAQRTVLHEALRIQRWEVNLYKPAGQIAYGELETALANLAPIVRGDTLPAGLRQEAHAAAARANLFMGRTREARRHLDAAIDLGSGRPIGEEYFERARLNWEVLLREKIAKNNAEASRLAERVKADLRAGLGSGFRDAWNRKLADTLLKLAQGGEKAVDPAFRELDELAKVPGTRSEEVAKFKGDLYLLLKDPKPRQAAAQFRDAVDIRKCYVQAWNGLALAHVVEGRGENLHELRQAFDATARAIEINPAYEDSYFLFMSLCRQTLRSPPDELTRVHPEARELLTRAIVQLRVGSRAQPDSAAIRTAHGSACVLLACFAPDPALVAEATEALQAAARLDPRRAEPWLVLGVVHTVWALDVRKESFEPARRSLERARDLEPENASVHRWLGYFRSAAADWPGAAAAWKRAVELDPELKKELEIKIRVADR